jgi:hypothetical protein
MLVSNPFVMSTPEMNERANEGKAGSLPKGESISDNKEPEYLTVAEAADLLRIAPKILQNRMSLNKTNAKHGRSSSRRPSDI